MDLEIINKLFLELSQVATATTARELKLQEEVERLKAGWKPAEIPLHPVTYEDIVGCPYCYYCAPALVTLLGDKFRVDCRCGASSMTCGSPVLAITYWNNVARRGK